MLSVRFIPWWCELTTYFSLRSNTLTHIHTRMNSSIVYVSSSTKQFPEQRSIAVSALANLSKVRQQAPAVRYLPVDPLINCLLITLCFGWLAQCYAEMHADLRFSVVACIAILVCWGWLACSDSKEPSVAGTVTVLPSDRISSIITVHLQPCLTLRIHLT